MRKFQSWHFDPLVEHTLRELIFAGINFRDFMFLLSSPASIISWCNSLFLAYIIVQNLRNREN